MSKTRYGHTGVGGGRQDQRERKDEGWRSRQGGDQSAAAGGGDASRRDEHDQPPRHEPPQGTNTQGELAGIGEASEEVGRDGDQGDRRQHASGARERDVRGAGTDQPRREDGPLGPDPKHPHLPEGAQNSDNQGTGAGGFDVGVNATVIGAVHQGARPEEER